MIVYKIDVIKELKDAGYNTGRILRENILSQSSMQRIRRGIPIGPKTLDKLCQLLDMQPGNILKYKDKID